MSRNNASGPEIWLPGRILSGKASKSAKQDTKIYLYDHPAGDEEVGGGERRPEEGSHDEREKQCRKQNIESFQWNNRGVFKLM